MLDFTKITDEQMQTAVTKLRDHDLGVDISKYGGQPSLSYSQLISSDIVHTGEIVRKMRNLGGVINKNVNDPVLENYNLLFTHTTDRDDKVHITHEDAYLFLRSALVHRQNTAEYKEKKVRLAEARATIERLKTPKEKRKEAAKVVLELEQELG